MMFVLIKEVNVTNSPLTCESITSVINSQPKDETYKNPRAGDGEASPS